MPAYLGTVTLLATALFGAVPIARVFQLDVNGALKGDARGTTQGLSGKYLAAGLVAVQMALAVVLLAARV
ncbi:MAG: hypothetical protein WDO18_04205 [Acidobacteriota bacterium]